MSQSHRNACRVAPRRFCNTTEESGLTGRGLPQARIIEPSQDGIDVCSFGKGIRVGNAIGRRVRVVRAFIIVLGVSNGDRICPHHVPVTHMQQEAVKFQSVDEGVLHWLTDRTRQASRDG